MVMNYGKSGLADESRHLYMAVSDSEDEQQIVDSRISYFHRLMYE